MELLEQIPRTMFFKADRAQQTRLLDHIRAAKPGELICIAEYVFTLQDFRDALVERKQVGVKVNLQATGADVKHLGLQRMHFKLVIVGITYAAGGSANLSLAAFTRNDDYVTEVEGCSTGVASARELFFEQYDCKKATLAEADEVAAALANLAATKAANSFANN
ncbi:hypothetical protein PHYBOEH_004960 [Phytophthora boehmeriae]|uniref:Phospholipase D-like domain-containing protein n=1 Tax=Phytophthora boehmeriae TaxID=109152 RepID=A0A8T1WQK8_9STRA|nr:hypothetical protein PHYBOEH_004960 [Phytophthora boehmeriae]